MCVWRIERSDPGGSNPIGGVRVEAGEDYGIREGKMRHEMATLQLHIPAMLARSGVAMVTEKRRRFRCMNIFFGAICSIWRQRRCSLS